MNKIAVFLLASMFIGIVILACGDQGNVYSTTASHSSECEFESITPEMFEIHDTTVTYYQQAVKRIFDVHNQINRSEFSIDCRGFEILAKIDQQTITFTSTSHEDHSYLLFSGKGVLKPETVDLFYDVSTPVKKRPI